MKKCKKYLQNNKLNIFTAVVLIVSVCGYVIGLKILKEQVKDATELLSASADYIAICSWLLLLVQIVSFVKDSRRSEHRARKEGAFDLAKLYANELLLDITYIQNVLSIHYNKNNPYELYESLKNSQLDEFILSELTKKSEYTSYWKLLKDDSKLIDFDLLCEQSVIFNNIMDMDDIKELDIAKQQEIANKRFRVFILETMNKLEYFSMAVNQNVAEGDMLYSSLHQSYIKFIYYIYPKICETNKEFEVFYTNVIELYRSWSNEKNSDEEIVKKLKKKAAYEMSRRYLWKSKRISEE